MILTKEMSINLKSEIIKLKNKSDLKIEVSLKLQVEGPHNQTCLCLWLS